MFSSIRLPKIRKIFQRPFNGIYVQNWIFEHLIFLYIAFILLFPKIPVYFISTVATPIRIDDLVTVGLFLVTVTLGLYLKRDLRPKYHRILGIVGFFVLSLVFSTTLGSLMGTINPLTGFGFVFRWIEYLIPLYVGLVTITSTTQARRLIYWLIILVFPIALYTFLQLFGVVGGYGGGFYSYEYVKVNDRVFAAFSGPYEIGAYYVLMLSMAATIFSILKNGVIKLLCFCVFVFGLISLSYVNARIPLAALMVSIVATAFLTKKWKVSVILLSFVVVIPLLISPLMLYRSNQLIGELNTKYLSSLPYFEGKEFQDGLSQYIDNSAERARLFKQFTTEHDTSIFFLVEKDKGGNKIDTPSNLPTLGKGQVPTGMPSQTPSRLTTQTPRGVILPSQLPTQTPPRNGLPTQLPTQVPTQTPKVQVNVEKMFAHTDASLSFRLKTVWPLAINAWLANPLLGGGFSVVGVGVDSEYLTLLAELGVLGILVFIYLLWSILRNIKTASDQTSSINIRVILIGMFSGIIGLIIEGFFVDAFRASKIAYLFWLLVAVVIILSKSEESADH